ncbi:MAG: endonuclease III domain-containing protein [Candidatus Altiarchaeota archaeon]
MNTKPTATNRRKIKRAYENLYNAYGRQHWWPADTPFEVCVGAILTQSTNWSNVEKAIRNLKADGVLSPHGLHKVRLNKLARLIKPALYYNVKARKLKEFVRFLDKEYHGDVENMRKGETLELREKLLSVWGLGPETVDSMLLYALGKPSFVVDAYTRRIFSRMGVVDGDATYDEIKAFFEGNLPRSVRHYNEYHALIVEHGKNVCKTKPRCEKCRMESICEFEPLT